MKAILLVLAGLVFVCNVAAFPAISDGEFFEVRIEIFNLKIRSVCCKILKFLLECKNYKLLLNAVHLVEKN
jgi:hypothetical protein